MAVTFDFTPVNGGTNATGSLESVVQLKAFLITIKDASDTAINLQSYDAAHGSEFDLIIREIQPLMWYAPSDTSGEIRVIVDGHAVDADTLQVRLRALVAGLGLGGTAATNDTTVALATSLDLA